MKLNRLHLLTSDLKKVVFNKSSRFPALLDNLYLPVAEFRNKQKDWARLHGPVIVIHSFKMGCFAWLFMFANKILGSFTQRVT